MCTHTPRSTSALREGPAAAHGTSSTHHHPGYDRSSTIRSFSHQRTVTEEVKVGCSRKVGRDGPGQALSLHMRSRHRFPKDLMPRLAMMRAVHQRP